jgi:hypothetical protein
MTLLADKVVALHRALSAAGVHHAFGGAIALAYCTGEPRGTIDIDLNVFVPEGEPEVVLAALPSGVRRTEATAARIRRDGQVRLRWETTPVDLFFNHHPFHDEASARVRFVPYEGTTIPVLDCPDLAVFKAFFGRSKDWVDIEAMATARTLGDARDHLVDLLGPDDDAIARFDEASHPQPPRRMPRFPQS